MRVDKVRHIFLVSLETIFSLYNKQKNNDREKVNTFDIFCFSGNPKISASNSLPTVFLSSRNGKRDSSPYPPLLNCYTMVFFAPSQRCQEILRDPFCWLVKDNTFSGFVTHTAVKGKIPILVLLMTLCETTHLLEA